MRRSPLPFTKELAAGEAIYGVSGAALQRRCGAKLSDVDFRASGVGAVKLTSVEADLLHQLGGGRSYDCHNQPTRKVQPKLPCPNCVSGTRRGPRACKKNADRPRAVKTPASRDARGARCNKHDNKQGYHRDMKALLTRYRVQSTLPPQRNYPPYLCRPTPGSAT